LITFSFFAILQNFSAENLFLAGLNDADGYQQVSLFTQRWLENGNDLDTYKYNFAKIGHYCK
jgi:hypothetical protein